MEPEPLHAHRLCRLGARTRGDGGRLPRRRVELPRGARAGGPRAGRRAAVRGGLRAPRGPQRAARAVLRGLRARADARVRPGARDAAPERPHGRRPRAAVLRLPRPRGGLPVRGRGAAGVGPGRRGRCAARVFQGTGAVGGVQICARVSTVTFGARMMVADGALSVMAHTGGFCTMPPTSMRSSSKARRCVHAPSPAPSCPFVHALASSSPVAGAMSPRGSRTRASS